MVEATTSPKARFVQGMPPLNISHDYGISSYLRDLRSERGFDQYTVRAFINDLKQFEIGRIHTEEDISNPATRSAVHKILREKEMDHLKDDIRAMLVIKDDVMQALYLRLRKPLNEGAREFMGWIETRAKVPEDVALAQGVVIDEWATAKGPLDLRYNVTIGSRTMISNSFVGAYTTIGSECVINHVNFGGKTVVPDKTSLENLVYENRADNGLLIAPLNREISELDGLKQKLRVAAST